MYQCRVVYLPIIEKLNYNWGLEGTGCVSVNFFNECRRNEAFFEVLIRSHVHISECCLFVSSLSLMGYFEGRENGIRKPFEI